MSGLQNKLQKCYIVKESKVFQYDVIFKSFPLLQSTKCPIRPKNFVKSIWYLAMAEFIFFGIIIFIIKFEEQRVEYDNGSISHFS